MKIIDNNRAWKIVALLGLTLFLLFFLWIVRTILTPFLFAFLLAYIIDPIIDKLEQYKFPRSLSILLIYLTIIGLILGMAFYGVPRILNELNRLNDMLPIYGNQLLKFVRELQTNYSKAGLPESVRTITDESIAKGEVFLTDLVRAIAEGAIGFFSQLLNIILAPILAFYMLKDFNRIGGWIDIILPSSYRGDIIALSKEINFVLRKFIRGNLIVAALVGGLTFIGMTFLRMEFALLIGLIAGITNIIPYFGPFIGVIPAVAIALTKSKWLALYVVGVMTVIQQVESNIISPKILGASVGLHPLMIVFALLAGGHLFGLMGMLLAVPSIAVLKILLGYCLEKLAT